MRDAKGVKIRREEASWGPKKPVSFKSRFFNVNKCIFPQCSNCSLKCITRIGDICITIPLKTYDELSLLNKIIYKLKLRTLRG